VKYGMNITHILINNRELGKIAMEQETQQLPVWETGLHNPNFAQYAEICGAKGIRVSDLSELGGAVTAALDHDGPALVEIVSDPDLI
jgi:thiamine pyrophosphate-dependent acetolactate synthase large subunit-like protein